MAALAVASPVFRFQGIRLAYIQVNLAGGHTAEMLTLTAHLNKQRYTPRCYVVAATDRMGTAKAHAAEADGGGVRTARL